MTSRLLGWSFTVLSVVVVWQFRLDRLFHEMATSLGARAESTLDKAFVDLGVPLVLTAALLVLNWFYRRLWWRVLMVGNYLGGWWVYSLLAQTPQGLRDTVGYFHVRHSEDNVEIDEAQAFWPLDALVLRGNWKSRTVWARALSLKIIYTMRSDRIYEGLPTDYEGYLELGRSNRRPVLGKQVWAGCFNDLKHRGGIRGPVYAERLSGLSRHDIDGLKKLLSQKSDDLLERVHEAWPVFSGTSGKVERPTSPLHRPPAGAGEG